METYTGMVWADWVIFILAMVGAGAILAGLFKWFSGMITDMREKARGVDDE